MCKAFNLLRISAFSSSFQSLGSRLRKIAWCGLVNWAIFNCEYGNRPRHKNQQRERAQHKRPTPGVFKLTNQNFGIVVTVFVASCPPRVYFGVTLHTQSDTTVTFSTNQNGPQWASMGPVLQKWSLGPGPLSRAYSIGSQSEGAQGPSGPLAARYYIAANQKGPTVGPAPKAPHLSTRAPNAPHLSMFAANTDLASY